MRAVVQQVGGVGAPNFDSIGFADTGRIEPDGRMVHILERPIR